MILDPDGSGHAAKIRIHGSNIGDLNFFRSQATLGARDFLTANLGINSFRVIMSSLVDRIPEDIRPDGKVTSHSGRRLMVITAIQGGVDSVAVSNVSQHRDINTLENYVDHSFSSSNDV
jgi:hypothetical protein